MENQKNKSVVVMIDGEIRDNMKKIAVVESAKTGYKLKSTQIINKVLKDYCDNYQENTENDKNLF